MWHDIECGGYEADLGVWERLAEEADGAVVDLGCGTGRVALHLARRGHQVTGVDLDTGLVAELERRALADELPAEGIEGDARSLDLGRRFGLVLAPMQLLQMLGGRSERIECLRVIARHLAPGGRAALAIVADLEGAEGSDEQPLPDVREVEGWIYSSRPLAVRERPDGFVVTRLRQTVSPAGEMSEERSDVQLHDLPINRLAAEARQAGLGLAETVEIPPSPDHVGSTVAILEAS